MAVVTGSAYVVTVTVTLSCSRGSAFLTSPIRRRSVMGSRPCWAGVEGTAEILCPCVQPSLTGLFRLLMVSQD